MKIFPAIDLMDNKCVRLTKGKEDSKVVFNENPVDQAMYFEQAGCDRLHLVDLDAAFGRGEINIEIIKKIRKSINIPIQIGGGIRSLNSAKKLLDLDINYLIIGSFSTTNIEKVIVLAEKYKEKIYISMDILKNKIMVKGWEEESSLSPINLFDNYNGSKIKGYVLTDIEKDGMLTGLNIKMICQNLKLTTKKLIVGGGLSTYDDLEALRKIEADNLEGVIIGKSYYVGNINIIKAQEIIKKNA